MKINQLIRTSSLLDFYSGLLNDNQKKILQSYLDYNASLSEIAEEMGITRQGVSDILRRSIAKLESIENKLGMYAKYENFLNMFPHEAEQLIAEGNCSSQQIRECIENLIKNSEV